MEPLTDPDDFFRRQCPVNVRVSRDAAKIICARLAEYDRQLIGLEGGIYRERDGTFEQKLDSVFSRKKKALTADKAHKINLEGIDSIDDDPEGYNAYYVISVGL